MSIHVPTGMPAPSYTHYADFASFSEAMRANHFDWDLRPVHPHKYSGQLYSRCYDGVYYTDIIFDALKGERNSRHINFRNDQYIGLNLFVDGYERISQANRDATVGAGELFLWDASRPTRFQTDLRTRCLSIFIPREIVRSRIPGLDRLLGEKLRQSYGLGALLTSHLMTLHARIDKIPDHLRSDALRITLEMLSLCFQPEAYASISWHQERHHRRIINFIDENLFDDNLSASSCASSLGMSDRYLRQIMAKFDTGFSSYVRKRRLERAADALQAPVFANCNITQIAHLHGFSDSAHFARLFAAEYGVTPSEFRRDRAGKLQ